VTHDSLRYINILTYLHCVACESIVYVLVNFLTYLLAGYVIGRAAGSCHKGFMSLLNMNTLRLQNVVPGDPQEIASNCQKKKFIVKAQLPISKQKCCVSDLQMSHD